MAESILKKHQLDITVGVELNDAQRKATSTQIKNMASQWQDILDDAIKKGIEDGARSASLKDVLTQFNAQLKAFKLEPLTITVDELQIMDKPIEHAAKLVIQKLGDSFKGGGLGNIISSEITDSLNTLAGSVDKIYQKMEQGAKKSAKNIAKSMAEIAEAADQYTTKSSMKKIDKAISSNPKKSTAEANIKEMLNASTSARKSGASWDKQYIADVNFVKNYKKVGVDTLKQIFGDQFDQVENYYNNLAKVHQQKIIALNDILAQKEFVGGSAKNPTQYQFKGEPWAREKTLQEVKQILSGGLIVKEGASGSGDGSTQSNLNTPKTSKDSLPKSEPQIKPQSETPIPKKDEVKVDTNVFNQALFDAIEKLFGKLQGLYKQMFADDIDDGEFDKIANSMMSSIKDFTSQFKFDNPKKVAAYLQTRSDDMPSWDSKAIHQSLSKKLSPEDPSWPRIEGTSTATEQIQAEADALVKNTKATKENVNAKAEAKNDVDAAMAAIFGETEVVEKNTEAKKRNKQVEDADNTPITPKTTITDNAKVGSTVASGVDTTVFSNLNITLGNLVAALSAEKSDVTAEINTAELSGVLHDGTPYIVDVQEQKGEVANTNAIASILQEIAKLPYEKMGMLNSKTGVVSDQFIKGDGWRTEGVLRNTEGFDTLFHNHPEDEVAVPGTQDLNTFIEQLKKFSQHLVVTGNEIAQFNFSKLPKDVDLKGIVEKIQTEFKDLSSLGSYVRKYKQPFIDEHQGQYSGEKLNKLASRHAMLKRNQDIVTNAFAEYPGVMSVYNTGTQDSSKLDEVLMGLMTRSAKPSDNRGDSEHDNKVSIDTEGLKSILTGITFKVQDASEREPVNSAIDQESINSLVGAIKTAITPQNDNTPKDSGPWAREETLRNITGSILGKIANNIPKVDTKGLARNDILNRVAQATEAINKKIAGKISGNMNKPSTAQQSQLFDAKVQSRVSALQTKYTKLDASGQLTPEIGEKIMGLWDGLDQVKDQPEFSLWLQQLQQVENEIQQIITLNKLNEQETKDSVGEIIAITKQYHDALIRAEKAKNPELQQFWTDEANKAWAEQERMQQDIESETGKRVDLTKQEIKLEQQLGAIRADKAGKAKAAQEKKDLADHNNAVQKLIDDYEELGRLRAQRDAMPDSTERTALQQEIKSKSTKLRRQSTKIGVNTDAIKNIADMAQEEEAAVIATRKHKEEYDELIVKIKERNKEQEKLAGADKDSKFAKDVQVRVDGLNQEISGIKKKIKLTKEEQAEVDKLNAKRDSAVNDKQNKKQDQADAKAFREELKKARQENNVDVANSRYTSGRKALNDLWVLDADIDPNAIPEVGELRTALKGLRADYDSVNQAMQRGDDVSADEIMQLQRSSDAVAKKTAKLKEMLAHYEKFKNGENIGQYVPGAADEETQLKNAINQQFGGKAKVKGFERDASGFLTAAVEVKEGARAFTEYKVAVEGADRSIRALKGNTKQLPGFLDSVKRKLGEISQYVSAMSVISRAGQELRRGIQYVREIDAALTELKKVTNETEETYDKFLDTASKTAAKVGSTIKDVISSTADWARLGYSMEQAAKFAESTQILMNVSEFTDVSRATDTLISAVQAFGYTAETSMEVVDLLNTIGNNYAISTADLASSLTKSSASLVAAGGNLAEAAALTATANAIVQDADSVGTALKTTSLRLRGTDVSVLEEEGVDSEGAVTSKSKLQSKVKALSGVDILTESGDYKSTYQILSQIADVWEDINNMDQAKCCLYVQKCA